MGAITDDTTHDDGRSEMRGWASVVCAVYEGRRSAVWVVWWLMERSRFVGPCELTSS